MAPKIKKMHKVLTFVDCRGAGQVWQINLSKQIQEVATAGLCEYHIQLQPQNQPTPPRWAVIGWQLSHHLVLVESTLQ